MNHRNILKIASITTAFLTIGTFSLKSKQTQAWIWGSGRFGQLGTGAQNNISLPQKLQGNFIQVDAGKGFTAAITSQGQLYTWGKNKNGVLGHQPPNVNVLIPRVITSIDKVVQVSCGSNHIVAVTQSGQAYIWGMNQPNRTSFRNIGRQQSSRQINNQVRSQKINVNNVKQVSVSGDYTTIVDKDGKVFIFNTSTVRRINSKVNPTNDIVQMDFNQKINRIQSGSNFSIALSQSGRLYSWGNNNFGQLGIGSIHSSNKPQFIHSLSNQKVKDFSCGQNFASAVTQKGQVYTWGFGNEGQLGHGNKSDQLLPTKVNLSQKIKNVSCGGGHSALITQSGKLLMMGRGKQGQLGRYFNDQGNTGYSLKIKPVQQYPKDKKVSQVSCGQTHTIVLLESLV